MNITPITSSNINFGYNSPLKTLYIKDKMPTVKYGFYGDTLTKKNVSLEHLLPHSKGGKSNFNNFVLASKRNNQLRGNEDIRDFVSQENIKRYLSQFTNIKLKGFNGKKYIVGIVETLKSLGVNFE